MIGIRGAVGRGRADGFMRFLGADRAGLILGGCGRQEVIAIAFVDIIAGFGHGLFRDIDRIGAHVGDQAGRAAFADLDAFV